MDPQILSQQDPQAGQTLSQAPDQLVVPIAEADTKTHEKGVKIIEKASNDPLKESKKVPASLEQVEERKWMIGGKIHFEENSTDDYLGIIEINEITRKVIKKHFKISNDICAPNAKVLLKHENNLIILTHYEEKSKPGIGEEMHATLLYTKRRIANGHETLHDIYDYLREVDSSLIEGQAPTVDQVANAYHLIIKPDCKFTIVSVEYVKGTTANAVVAKLEWNGRDEILNKQGHPISGGFLHITLVNIDASMTSEEEKIQALAKDLHGQLCGKFMKIGSRGELADLEFGQSGSKERVRPPYTS